LSLSQMTPDTYPEDITFILKTLEKDATKRIHATLLWGEKGTGKTTIAHALAKELDVPFINLTSSYLFKNAAGSGERVRKIFDFARQRANEEHKAFAIILCDEFDGIAKPTNDASKIEAKEELQRQLDRKNDSIFFIGATNFSPERLDQTLTRYGRFNSKIEFSLPDDEARKSLLTNHLTQAFRDGITELLISTLINDTAGFSHADIRSIIETATIHCEQNKHLTVEGAFNLIIEKMQAEKNLRKICQPEKYGQEKDRKKRI